jgi:hypothetical protein
LFVIYPEGQLIKTNQQNILIRSLLLKKQKGESSSKDSKGTAEDGPKKRAANRALDDRSSAKRAANASRQGYLFIPLILFDLIFKIVCHLDFKQ